MRIYKHRDSVKDATVGDIVEIKPDIFLRIEAIKKSYDEYFGKNKSTTRHFTGTVVDLK